MLSSLVLLFPAIVQGPLLPNADFEQPVPEGFPPVGWTIDMGRAYGSVEPASVVRVDNDLRHGGKASVLLEADEATRLFRALRQDLPVKIGGLYKLKGWVRAQDVRKALVRATQEEQEGNCYLGILFYDWNNELIAETHQMPAIPQSDWQELSMYYVAPEKTRKVQVVAYLSMSGRFWIDDLEMSLDGGEDPPPVRELLKQGFEEENDLPQGWTREIGLRTGNSAKASIVGIDPTQGVAGSTRSLRMSGDEATGQWYGLSRRFPAASGDGIVLRAMAKAANLRKEALQHANFYIGLMFVGADGKQVGAPYNAHSGPGTYDWKQVEVRAVAPEGAVGVMAGIFCSMSGEAWIDDIAFTSQAGATPAYVGWEELRGQRVVMRFSPDHPERSRIEYYGTRLDTAFESAHKKLGLPYGAPITIYLYADKEQGRKLTGREIDFNNGQARVVHQMLDSQPGHEMTHVIATALGFPTSDLFNEGLAVYLDGSPTKELHAKAAKLKQEGKLVPIATLLQHFHSEPEVFVSAGSFTGFVLETYGPEKFRLLYTMPDVEKNASSVLPDGLAAAEKTWHAYLKQFEEKKAQ